MTNTTIDVRPILAAGGCPFDTVMEAGRKLKPGSQLTLIAPFNPLPIYDALAAIGFSFVDKETHDADFHVHFRFSPLNERELVVDKDLTDLEPPQPMMAAMECYAQIAEGETFRVHTRFHPVHLMGKLEEQDCVTHTEERSDGTWLTWVLKRGERKCEH
jgi:uncharacterized protein (DUF2249 family)